MRDTVTDLLPAIALLSEYELIGERDGFGRTLFVHEGTVRPEPLNVRLTLDIGLQYLAERELTQAVKATGANGGVVVILEPQTFAVLALAQVPTFNPNTPAAVRPETRRKVIRALEMLQNKADRNPPKKHGNIPL